MLFLCFWNREKAENEQRIRIGINLKSQKHAGKFGIINNNNYAFADALRFLRDDAMQDILKIKH